MSQTFAAESERGTQRERERERERDRVRAVS